MSGNIARWLLSALLIFAISAPLCAEKRLTNQDVIQMVSMGLSDEVVIEKIKTAKQTDFDTSMEALKALKAAKVSDAVIKYVINPKFVPATVANSAPLRPHELPEDVGVYIRLKGQLREIHPEIINWKTGGIGKSMLTMGMTKGHVNGTVREAHSPVQAPTPLEFIVKCPEGTSVAEYQLLRMDEKADRREFRAITGGIIHASSGAGKNVVQFEFEKIAPRVFRVKLASLDRGEYGFLPPGMTSASMASGGKIYSFGVIE